MAQKLKSGDISIYTAHEIETQKLIKEKSRTQVFEKKDRIVTKSLGVIEQVVRIDSINMKEKEFMIKQI